jgi:hypothetical protein
MARLVNPVFGNFKGRIGTLSARVRNGVTILSARPSSFNPSDDPENVAIRNRFRVTSGLSSAINDVDDLKKIWDKVSPAGMSAFNAIFKENFDYSDEDKPTINNKLTPDGGFGFDVTSAVVDAAAVVVDLPALNTFKTFGATEQDLSVHIILVPFDPIDPQYDYFSPLPLEYNEANYDSSAALNFTVNLTQSQQNETALYNQSLLLMCLATKDSQADVVEYSSTYSQAG